MAKDGEDHPASRASFTPQGKNYLLAGWEKIKRDCNANDELENLGVTGTQLTTIFSFSTLFSLTLWENKAI